jgi:tight adherence protein C
MALGIASLLFVFLTGLITVFGYRRYVRAGRVYENLAVGAGRFDAPAAPANPRFFTVVSMLERVGRKMPPSAGNASRLQHSLLACGYRGQNAVAIFLGSRILLAASVLLPTLLFEFRLSLPASARLLAIAGAAIIGYALPEILLKRRIRHRQRRLRQALPDALDLMVVCGEAGLAIDRSFQTVTQQLAKVHPELSDEFSLVRAEITAGIRRQEALENLAWRTQEQEIRKFVAVLTQADRFGTTMGDALRTHADYLRIRRRQHAEERASKVGVKLIFPVFFFIMPSLLLVTVGPAAIQIVKNLGTALGGSR